MHTNFKWLTVAAAVASGGGELLVLRAATVVVTPVADSFVSEIPINPPTSGGSVVAGTTAQGVRALPLN